MSMAPIKLQKMLHCIILPMESRQRRGKHFLAGCYVEVVVILGGEMEFHRDNGGSEEATGLCSNLGYLLKHLNENIGWILLVKKFRLNDVSCCSIWKCVKYVEPTRVREALLKVMGKLLMWVKPSRLIRIVRVYTSEQFPSNQTNIRIIHLQHQVSVSIQLLKQTRSVRCHHKPLHVGLNFHRSQGQRLLPFGGLHYEMS